MSGERRTWEVREELRGLDLNASSTALTSTLQRCALEDTKVKLDSDLSQPLSQPLSLSSPRLASRSATEHFIDVFLRPTGQMIVIHLCLTTALHRGRLRRRSDLRLSPTSAAADFDLARRGILRRAIGPGLRLLCAPCAARPLQNQTAEALSAFAR